MSRIFLILFFLISFANASSYILLLQSYNKGLSWSDNISKGVEDALSPLKNYELSTEYLDDKRNKDKEYHKLIRDAFIQKFKKQSFDIVIAADNAAVNFVLENKNDLFKDIPIIFTGIEEMVPGINVQEVLKQNISLILEHKPLSSNIEFILKTLPDLKYLYVINDNTYTSQMINDILKSTLEEYKNKIDYKLYLDGDLSIIKKDIENLPKNSAVWHGNLYLDEKENYIPSHKVENLLRSSKVPVFAMTDAFLKKGIIGGHLLRGYYVGYEAGKRVVDILNKKEIDYTKPVLAKTQWLFDYEMLKKYNLENCELPKDALIINQPETFFEKYRVLIDRIFLAFPFILIFLLIALFNIYQKNKIAKQLISQSEREQILLSNVTSAIFWIDNKGLIRGYNQSFSDLFVNEEEILGRNIQDIFNSSFNSLTLSKLALEKDLEFKIKMKSYIARSKNFYDEKDKNSGIVVIITDISDKKQLEINKQFIVQQSKLTEVGEMLSAIVHQWKVPLVELSVVAHKMQRYYQKDKLNKSDMDIFFDTIMKQIIYMGNTIDEFRQFIKPSNKPVKFDIDKGIKEIETILEASMKYNNIDLIYKNYLTDNKVLYGYPNEFKQVLLSIINNAKDSIIESRKNKKSGKIEIIVTQRLESIHILVIDDGKGFSNETINSVFEAFFSTKDNGDGFGLYMAKLIIENKMNALIRADNIKNGAQIFIQLPLIKDENI